MKIGLEVVASDASPLAADRVGLLMNRASVDANLRLASDVLYAAIGGRFSAIFTPQHGLWGEAQANMIESPHGYYHAYHVPIHSLYSETRRPTGQMLHELDCLVVDLPDVGTRVYTYAWTVLECLRACREAGVRVLILDRPNPLSGSALEGALLEWEFTSFVGGANVPMRHGLTLGELARLFQKELGIDVSLEVVPVEGWSRDDLFPDWGRHWIAPSPNLPRFEAALNYPGQVLLEGTNLSEGRGTTTPFEVAGAPFIVPEALFAVLNATELPGVRFLPIRFCPTFDKWANQSCGGVSLHVTNPVGFCPYQTAVALLAAVRLLWPREFGWIEAPYEYEQTKVPIDIISGSSALRQAIDSLPSDRPSDLSVALNSLLRSSVWKKLWKVDSEAWEQRTRAVRLY